MNPFFGTKANGLIEIHHEVGADGPNYPLDQQTEARFELFKPTNFIGSGLGGLNAMQE